MDLKNINLYIKLLSKTGCNDFCRNAEGDKAKNQRNKQRK